MVDDFCLAEEGNMDSSSGARAKRDIRLVHGKIDDDPCVTGKRCGGFTGKRRRSAKLITRNENLN